MTHSVHPIRMFAAALVALLVLLPLAGAAPAGAAKPGGTAPANDAFASATVVGGLPFADTVATRKATKAADDPAACAGYVRSVWYRFTATSGQRVVVDTIGSGYDTLLAVYTGSQGNLTQVGCNDNANGTKQSRVAFDPANGTDYAVMVGARTTKGGDKLQVQIGHPPVADSSAPSIPVLALTEADTDMHAAGTTLFYNPAGNGGTFTVGATASDAQSGIAHVAFPAVFGGDAANDTSLAYSHAYSWNTGASASGARDVSAVNGAGLSASAAFTVTPDSGAPSVAITAPAAGEPVSNGRTVTANATDALAGVDTVEFRYCPGTSCAFGAGTPIGTDTNSPWAVDWAGQPGDGAYAIVARATDHVGNTADATVVAVNVNNSDTTAPTGPALTITENETDEHVNGTTLYYRPARKHAGTFTVTAVTADAETGVQRVAFPAVFGGDAANDTTAAYQQVYAWRAGATASGAKTVTAVNGLNLTADAAFTVVPDLQRPVVAIATPSQGSKVRKGDVLTATATDALAGVAKVQFRYCPGTTCTWSKAKPIGTATSAPYSVTWTKTPAPGTYTILAMATDNVGNKKISKGRVLKLVSGATSPAIAKSAQDAGSDAAPLEPTAPVTTTLESAATSDAAVASAAAAQDQPSGLRGRDQEGGGGSDGA